MTGDDIGETVVGQCRQLAGRVRIEHLHARRREGQQLHVDAVLIHVAQARMLDVEQTLEEIQYTVTGVLVVDPSDQLEVETLTGYA